MQFLHTGCSTVNSININQSISSEYKAEGSFICQKAYKCVPAAEIQLIPAHTVDCTDNIPCQRALSPLSDKIFSVAPTDSADGSESFCSLRLLSSSPVFCLLRFLSQCLFLTTACFPSDAAPWSKYNQYFIMTVYQWPCVM